jgi:hypothetical protein
MLEKLLALRRRLGPADALDPAVAARLRDRLRRDVG